MSNIHKTPDFDRASINYYITPIKKKKMDFNSEINFKPIDNQKNNIQLSNSNLNNSNSTTQILNFYSADTIIETTETNINNTYDPNSNNLNSDSLGNNNVYNNNNFSNFNNFNYNNSNTNQNLNSESKNFEILKRNETELMCSAFKKYFSSPYSNPLKQSPASFQNYMNSYSHEKIDVLKLLNKKHYGNHESKGNENNPCNNIGLDCLNNQFDSSLANDEYEKENENGANNKTPFRINSNLIAQNKFISPRSNDKSNYHDYYYSFLFFIYLRIFSFFLFS